MKYFKRLRARHWAWLNFLLSIGIAWPIFMIVTPPEVITEVIDPITYSVIMPLCLLGTALAMFGYFASQQLGKLGVIGVSLELAGFILSLLGPLSYLVTRSFLYFNPAPGTPALTTGFFFSYALCAIYLYRFIIIIPRFRFEATDPSKE